jgi:hypothetical protein
MDPASADDILTRLCQAGFHCTALELVQELQEAAIAMAGMPEVLHRHMQCLQDVVMDKDDGPSLFDQCLDATWWGHRTASALQHALNTERAASTALRAQLAEAVHAVPVCEGDEATPLEKQRLDVLVQQYLLDRGLRLTAVTMCEEVGDTPATVIRDAPLVTLLRQALLPRESSMAAVTVTAAAAAAVMRPPLHTRTMHHCSIAPTAWGRSSDRDDPVGGSQDGADVAPHSAGLALVTAVAKCLVPTVKTVVTARRLELLPLLHVLLTSSPAESVQTLLDVLPALVRRHACPDQLSPLCAMVLAVAEHRGLPWTVHHLVPWALAGGHHGRPAVRLGVACTLLAAASPSQQGRALSALSLQHVQALSGLLERSVDDAVSPACVTWALGVVASAWSSAAVVDVDVGRGQASRLLLGVVHDVSQAMVLAGAQQQQEDNDSGGNGDGDGDGDAAAWSAALWNDVLPHVRAWAALQGMLWRLVANSWLTVWQEAMSGLTKDRSSDSGDASSAGHGLVLGHAPAGASVTPAVEKQWLVAAQWFQHSWVDVAAAVKAPVQADVQMGACPVWRAPTPCACVRTFLDAVLAQAVWFTDSRACESPSFMTAAAVDAWEGVRWLCLQALPTLLQAALCASGQKALLNSIIAVMSALCGAMGPAFTTHVLTPVLYSAAGLPKSLLSECCDEDQAAPADCTHSRPALEILVGPECGHWAPGGGGGRRVTAATGPLVVCVLGVWHGGKCMDAGARRALVRAVCKLPEVVAAVAREVAPLMTTTQLGEWLESMAAARGTAPMCVAVCRARAALNPVALESWVLPQVLQVLTGGGPADPKALQAACMAAGRMLPLVSPGGQAALHEGLHASWSRGPTSAVNAVVDGMQFATAQPGARDVVGVLMDECRLMVDAIVAACKAGNQAMGTISHHIACTFVVVW